MILVNIWSGLPFFIILMVAGLKAIDAEQYEAASIDGASPWRKFLHITLPGLKYVIIVACLLNTIFTFNGFTLTYLLTGGGPGGATRIYTILAYEYAVQGLRYGAGTAVALTVAPMLFFLILFLGRFMMSKGDDSRTDSEDSLSWKFAMTIIWPLRMLAKGALMVFWFVNDIIEMISVQRCRRCGQQAQRPCCRVRRAVA